MKEYLKISRPGLWFPTLWIYVLPIGGQLHVLSDWTFWIGLVFVSFPLNFFVYGLNDLGDIDADRFNLRKGNFMFGAKASKATLQRAVKYSSILLLLFALFFSWLSGPKMLILFGLIAGFNYIYNFKPFRIKSKPPFELLIQVAYILTAVFSAWLNDVQLIPWQAFVYLCFFAFQAHLAGEIMDMEPDRMANKRTTALILGRIRAKLLMAAFLSIEVWMLVVWFEDLVLASALAAFLIWLFIDMFFIFRNKAYSLYQMYLFGYGTNILGFGSMLWISYSGYLLKTF